MMTQEAAAALRCRTSPRRPDARLRDGVAEACCAACSRASRVVAGLSALGPPLYKVQRRRRGARVLGGALLAALRAPPCCQRPGHALRPCRAAALNAIAAATLLLSKA